MTDIDNLAGMITGHRDLFHDKGTTAATWWDRWRKENG